MHSRRIRFLRTALLALLVSAFPAYADEPAIGDGINDVPLFDAHMHYKEPAWSPFPVEDVIGLMDKTGVAMSLVSSSPDEGTIMLLEYAPQRIVPELRPYHGDVGSSNWTSAPGMQDYLRGRLEKHPHEGIGEFHIRGESMQNETLFRDVIAMARKRNIPLHIHSDADSIRWVYGLDPDVKIIWAHAGLGDSPDEVYALMKEFPNLWADTSLKEHEILSGPNGLHDTWRRIATDFQDRLMIGSDTWVNGMWASYTSIIRSNRKWLSQLPRSVAEKIAYKNAEKLFGRKVSMDQIGTR